MADDLGGGGMAEVSNREILRAIIRGLKFLASLLEKVLKGEPV